MIARLGSGLAAASLALSLGAGLALSPPAATPATARQAIDLSDLAERVMDAVVNISTSSRVDTAPGQRPGQPPQGRRPGQPQQPGPGAPFDELFEEFFRRRGENPPGGPNGQQQQQPQRRQSSLGSGFVVDASGIVITNNHVIDNADEITVIFNDGTRLKAELVGRDRETDIAVLRVQPTRPLKAVNFADSDRIRIGEPVMAIGNPLGLGGTVTAGIVSAKNRDIQSGPFDNYIQTDAAINRGNSGGPLFNMAGDVIGINTAIFSQSGGNIGIAFAVPANTARPVVAQLREFGETRRGWLGVRIQEVTDEIAESLSLGGRRGALIAGVEPNGPAGPAGIKTGDVIVRFDGREVRNSRELPRIVSETAVGKAVPVTVVRAGKEEQLTVTLGRREGNIQQASTGDQPRGQPPRPQNPTVSALGLQLSGLTQELRQRFSLREDVRGVVVTQVDPNSRAAERSIEPGNVILEVQNEPVVSPADVTRRIEDLRREGRSSALFLVANAQGDRRFVALTLR
ncbi:Do family serine endopeptidase [Phreatobacter oligotrophus]|jgi:serine protease Do|uniref:Probable periplasmic serine endoprotease DegP-like n=1 Tax=Phreatobacter oligotrophus TaxID=1122261 RepID=A0A2T4ZHN1_9HYPH|nr:Do family serine endopeptidase [Phreatobacter oligotrophus]PTM61488.1 serine protease Do [Phreatobacter oligotrophus]